MTSRNAEMDLMIESVHMPEDYNGWQREVFHINLFIPILTPGRFNVMIVKQKHGPVFISIAPNAINAEVIIHLLLLKRGPIRFSLLIHLATITTIYLYTKEYTINKYHKNDIHGHQEKWIHFLFYKTSHKE